MNIFSYTVDMVCLSYFSGNVAKMIDMLSFSLSDIQNGRAYKL